MNAAVVDIIEQYKRFPLSVRREVMEKLRDIDQDWDSEFDELDNVLPDTDVSMEDIQREIKAHRIEQQQKTRQNVPSHS